MERPGGAVSSISGETLAKARRELREVSSATSLAKPYPYVSVRIWLHETSQLPLERLAVLKCQPPCHGVPLGPGHAVIGS